MDQLVNGFVSSRDLINWQTEMSNSAHQREVADLKAAGLNPVLSAHTNGASTPSGASDDMSTLLQTLQMSVANTAKSLGGSGGGRRPGSGTPDEEQGIEFLSEKSNLALYIDALRQNPKGTQKIFGVPVPNAWLVSLYDKYEYLFEGGKNNPPSTSANPDSGENEPNVSIPPSSGRMTYVAYPDTSHGKDPYINYLKMQYPGKSEYWYEWKYKSQKNRAGASSK